MPHFCRNSIATATSLPLVCHKVATSLPLAFPQLAPTLPQFTKADSLVVANIDHGRKWQGLHAVGNIEKLEKSTDGDFFDTMDHVRVIFWKVLHLVVIIKQ